MIGVGWISDNTVGGAAVNGSGKFEQAHIELPAGDIVFDGQVFDPLPVQAQGQVGKQRILVETQNAGQSELRTYDPVTHQFGAPIAAPASYYRMDLSRSGHRVVVSGSSVNLYDGFTGDRIGAIPGGCDAAITPPTSSSSPRPAAS
jgi:hypothetical protein